MNKGKFHQIYKSTVYHIKKGCITKH